MKLLVICALAACGPSWRSGPHDQLFQIDRPTKVMPKPTGVDVSDWWDRGDLFLVRPLGQMLSPGTYVQALVGSPPARDTNHLGQVPDSAWFENRIGRDDYALLEAREGAAYDVKLAAGPLAVISGKLEGASAGFVVRDTASQVWFLKLDHPGFPELSTSAEVITSRLLWLAGYRVPSMQVLDLEVSRLVLDPKARTKGRYNRSIPLTSEALRGLLANANPNLEGRVRVLISAQPSGTPSGPFSYRGTRADDPNDTIPHQHRRSLRGLWLFSAWVNNHDVRDANTLDMFRPSTRDGRGTLDHYLIDFGDSFGSTGLGEKAAMEGWQHLVDWRSTFLNLITFGLRSPAWKRATRSSIRAVGLFEAKVFEPTKWRPELPNLAFSQRTREDVFWAGSILARIQPAHIGAAVEAGKYTEEGASTYVVETLMTRRRKLLAHAFEGFLELDRPRGTKGMLQLDNLRYLGGFPDRGAIQYVVKWNRSLGFDRELGHGSTFTDGPVVSVDLTEIVAAHDLGDEPYLTVELSRGRLRMSVHLRVSDKQIVPIGVER